MGQPITRRIKEYETTWTPSSYHNERRLAAKRLYTARSAPANHLSLAVRSTSARASLVAVKSASGPTPAPVALFIHISGTTLPIVAIRSNSAPRFPAFSNGSGAFFREKAD